MTSAVGLSGPSPGLWVAVSLPPGFQPAMLELRHRA